MNNGFVAGVLVAVAVLEVGAVEWENMSWEQRWDASVHFQRLANEAERSGQVDSALVLLKVAQNAHPSNYKIYAHRWGIIRRNAVYDSVSKKVIRQNAVYDSSSKPEIIRAINEDIRTIATLDHNDDQIFVLSIGYDLLYELTGDDANREVQRGILEGYLSEKPESLRAQDFLCTLARISNSPEMALAFYRRALSRLQVRRPSELGIYQAMLNIGIALPTLMSAEEVADLLRRWEVEVQEYSEPDRSKAQYELDRFRAKVHEGQEEK